MKDKEGNILYIGKASSLKKRVSSYFRPEADLSSRIKVMVGKIEKISFFLTASEAEALITERAFIKKYKPRYNVALKDDKSYPYLKLTLYEEFPRLILTRKKRDDKGTYYGPYTDVKLLRKALNIMKRVFPLRTCKRMPKKICLNYHIAQCYAPCIQAISKTSYADIVRELKLFLSGRKSLLLKELSKKMKDSSQKRDYEKAALLRDRIIALSTLPRKIKREKDQMLFLAKLVGLKRRTRKIEAYDISNISGKEAVGSLITFIDGKPSKNNYRKFKIKSVEGIDDYKMMKEVIRRRYEKVKKERLSSPDLIIVDGGKGQLNACYSVLKELGFERIPVIGIAKKFEHIYLRKRKEPIVFSKNSPMLHLIERLRDEAHRFAIGYHHLLRSKKVKESILDKIEGIGDKRKKTLLKKYPSLENIRKVSLRELSSLRGMNIKTARRIKEYLAKT